MNRLDELIDESLDRLVPTRIEQSDWEDILSRLRDAHKPERGRRSRWLLPVAAVLAVLAAALAVTTPWHNGPSVIAKASAAISVGSADILHERATIAPLAPNCGTRRVQPGSSPCPRFVIPPDSIELWVEGGNGTRSFRAITRRPTPHPTKMRIEFPAAPFGNALATNRAQVQLQEIGGTLGPSHVRNALVYQRYSNTLIRFTQAPTAITSNAFDPVALVRAALAAGHARVAGNTVIAGRRVRTIKIALHSLDTGAGAATYYVDRSTYEPVEIAYPRADFLQFPYTPVFAGFPTGGIVVRFATFETLPSTAATRALTEIRNQHKTAKVVCGVEFGLPDC